MKLIFLHMLGSFVAITAVFYSTLQMWFVTESYGKPCSTVNNLPVVNICTDESKFQDNSNSVLIKADSRKNCTCKLSVVNQDKTISINIQKFEQIQSSSPTAFGCGLILKFGIGSENFWDAQCVVNNSLIAKSIYINDIITIQSFSVNGTLNPDEGYCIEFAKAGINIATTGNKLKLTCGIGSTTSAYTTKTSAETTTTMSITTHPLPSSTTIKATTAAPTRRTRTTAIDTNQFTLANFTSTDFSVSTKQARQQQIITDNDDTTVLAAGTSVGGFVIIIVVIGAVCIYRRYQQKPISKQGASFDNDYDAYGMRENILYVPSQSADLTSTQTNADCQDTNRISVDIDGNYSTVDLDEIPSVEESTGDYNLIDLVKLTPTDSNMSGSTNEKPIIAPKPKQKIKIEDDVYSVPDKKRVKHVTAPGENGCEYAIVSKPIQSNVDKSEDQPSASNVYAVVVKKKSMSCRKVINQKRDSLTAENDG